MDAKEPFSGQVIADDRLKLGEGPSFEVETGTLWWFDILGCTLYDYHLKDRRLSKHTLPFHGTVIARVDDARQMIASDQGLFIRQRADGQITPFVALESDQPGNRSNDGRVHPSGALWIGTMGRKAETGAGAIYHVAGTKVTKLFSAISIPNAICFSPDGSVGYFTDSKDNRMMRVDVDPRTGLPIGAPSVLVDGRNRDGVFDGSVVDMDGTIWNARWGGGSVDRYKADGTLLARYDVPAQQVTCPAFVGENHDRLIVTSAWEGMSTEARHADPLAGATFELGVAVRGKPEPSFKF
ncbi:SMP-30/gluconolactonase/LRE family protein [Peteryoungia desertarenae]|uniref:SMP-30/gluconolactonase/LRE family protein n=1 Tax=Peteryoungia desertarenae TaxID=1813451 RepID=A0ABX6QLW2_9HYPH|nr:SMP-30/gluconolactonase/LRE family protein [Peteryoungia desertarenae]QLF69538.1 SMP-30/gluconolactonase/LRE family protein [Peteryoungia desertarenae]